MRKEGVKNSNRNCFVIDFHPALRVLYNIFRELQVIVSWSERFLSIMPEQPMGCFRRSKNLKDHLVRSKLGREEETVVGCLSAERRNVKICDNVIIGGTFKSHVEGRSFCINRRFDCESEGLSDFLVQVIDVTDVNNPTERESFWIEKLNSYVPRGFNLREEV